jgi:hypothetical protein
MVPGRAAAHDVGMPRLLVLWSRPQHLTGEEAERWARAEARALLAHDGVGTAVLARLEKSDWNWMLELEVTAPAHRWLDRGPCAEWLGDLRLLGMRPVVMVVADAVDLDGVDD